MFMSGLKIFKQSFTKSFCFTLENMNYCFGSINQQDVIYGKKCFIKMMCCNVEKFPQFLSI